MDVLGRADLPFPHSLPEFQRLFPDDAACAAYLEKARWGDGFACPHCGTAGEPSHFENRPGVLRCRKCRKNTGLTVGTVMERSHTPLNVWFWAAYLFASQTPGMSAVQFQRQLGLSRYETAFQILHKLRSGMVRPTKTGSVDSPRTMLRWTKPGLAGERVGKAVVFTTRFPFLLRSRCVIESRAPSSTTGKTDAMPDAFGSRWCRKVGGKLENWRKLLIVKHSERRCAAAERSLRHETSYGIDVAQSIFR